MADTENETPEQVEKEQGDIDWSQVPQIEDDLDFAQDPDDLPDDDEGDED